LESDYNYLLLLQVSFYEIPDDFVAAILIVIALFCFISAISIAHNAILSLTQDELNEIELSPSKKDKTLWYLFGRLNSTIVSCNVVQFTLFIIVTLLSVFCVRILNLPIPQSLNYLIAFAFVTILEIISFAIVSCFFINHNLIILRVLTPLLQFVVKITRPFIRRSPIFKNEKRGDRKKNQPSIVYEAPGSVYEEKEMLEEIIHFYDKKANEIMTPRTDIEAVNFDNSIDEVIKVIVESGYSRIPVYGDDEDDIKGILFAKDIIPALNNSGNNKPFEWQKLIRKAYFIPESKKIEHLLSELRGHKTHMAVVVDEFGCTSGLVTMEDIVEEIIGDISDEYDDDEQYFLSLPDGSFIFEGKTQLNDFFRETGISPSDFSAYTEEAETLTGLLLAIKSTLPRRRDVIEFKDYKFVILEADERRVQKVKVTITSKPDNTDDND
jgi:CBS domain containing-hemolysin-like protein